MKTAQQILKEINHEFLGKPLYFGEDKIKSWILTMYPEVRDVQVDGGTIKLLLQPTAKEIEFKVSKIGPSEDIPW